jgi:carbonic anhydrase
MVGRRVGLADNWLRHVQDVNVKHGRYLGQVLSDKERADRLCELNVIEQVHNLCQTTIIQDAWERGQPVTVHSIVYGVHDGLLRDLGVNLSSQEQLEQSLRTAFAAYE